MALTTYKDLCIDASDAPAVAAFWAPLLGWEAHVHEDGDASLRRGDGVGEVMVWVNQVPEPVTVKNRLHLDLKGRAGEEVDQSEADQAMPVEHGVHPSDSGAAPIFYSSRWRSPNSPRLPIDRRPPRGWRPGR